MRKDMFEVLFMEKKDNCKTHLATAIGIEVVSQRVETYFINFSELMEKFKKPLKKIELRVL